MQISASYKPAYIYGGPVMSVSKLSEQMIKAGCTIEVFTTTANGLKELPVVPNIPVGVDGIKVTYFKRITKDHSHLSPVLMRQLWKNIKQFDAVHVHAWWNLVSVCSCLIALLRGVPVVVSPRGTLSSYSFNNKNIGVKWLMHHLLGRFLLNRVHVHVTSVREQDAVLKIISPKNIYNIPNFVKLPNNMTTRTEVDDKDNFSLLFFSRIQEKKGLDILLEALARITLPYQLTIAGDGDENYIKHLKAVAVKFNIEDKITWAGFFTDDKFDLLSAHDLFVLPSYDENFGNSVIESLGAGTPVLISGEVGLADYVKNNDLGWICQTTAASVSRAINEIIGNKKAELDRIRKEAPAIIYRDFADDHLTQKYMDMYKKVIQ